MQRLVTGPEMQEFDRAAIKGFGIPGLLLMENAGRAFVDELEKIPGGLLDQTVLVVSGKGNNGGDGYVIARHLLNRAKRVDVVFLCRRQDVKGDAKTNLDILVDLAKRSSGKLRVTEVLSASRLRAFAGADIIVDAIFGTGFAGSATGLQKDVITWINQQPAVIASVDIPSGVNASTGEVAGVAIRAHLTVTMALPKIGHYVGKGREHAGKVRPVDISIPHTLFSAFDESTWRITGHDVGAVLPTRSLSAHKYDVGKVFVLAGSRHFSGAPALCARAVLSAGAGAVILGIPDSLHQIVASHLTEIIFEPLAETSTGTVARAAQDSIDARMAWADVVVIGPGLGRNEETDQLVQDLVKVSRKPIVLDADGLTAFSNAPAILKSRKSPTVLTPHAGELSRLIGLDAASIESGRVEVARTAAKDLKSILVLKGSPTVCADPNGMVVVNSTGNPGMATIGAGDVLTGVIAGLMAQGEPPMAAAYSGVYLHGRAGDHAAERYGQKSMVASDILCSLPRALLEVEGRDVEAGV
jgi:hydroxyethylthiazole kinase-like uncharacterized protein yjeF